MQPIQFFFVLLDLYSVIFRRQNIIRIHIWSFLADWILFIWVVLPRTGKMSNICHFFLVLELYCGQTVWFFEVSSTVLKRFCPLESKNTFVLVLAIFLDTLWKIRKSQKIQKFWDFHCNAQLCERQIIINC